MAVSVSYPGVYVEEFAPAPPIQGVSTSITALLGPAAAGPILEPQLVTSWDQFKQIYGRQPVPGFYLWYAARGFFENEGQLLYVVRISNAAAAELTQPDRAAAAENIVVVSALDPGAAGNGIQVDFTATQAMNNMVAFKHDPQILSAAGTQIRFNAADDAAKFRPGDIVSIEEDAAPAPRTTILSINGDTVTLSSVLASAAAGNHLRLADLQTVDGDRVIRFQVNAPDDPVYLVPGTILQLNNGAFNEYAVVESVAMEFITLSVPPPLVTYRVTLRNGVANDYGLAPGDPALDATSREFDLTVQDLPTVENYHFLSVDPLSPRYYGTLVNGHSGLVILAPAQPPDSHLPPDNLPDGTLGLQNLAGGLDEVLSGLLPNDYQNGLDALVNIDVNIIAIPDRQDATVQGYLIDHCQGVPPKAGNRFAILDSQLERADHRRRQRRRPDRAARREWTRLRGAVLPVGARAAGSASVRGAAATGRAAQCARSTLRPRRGRVRTNRQLARRAQGTGRHRGEHQRHDRGRASAGRHRAGSTQPSAVRDQRHPRLPRRPTHRLGRTHECRRRRQHELAVRQHPPAVPLPRGLDHRRNPVRRVRAEQPRALGKAEALDLRVPHARLA